MTTPSAYLCTAFFGTAPSSVVTSTFTLLAFSAVTGDGVNAPFYNTTTSQFVIPLTGWYSLNAVIDLTTTGGAAGQAVVRVVVNSNTAAPVYEQFNYLPVDADTGNICNNRFYLFQGSTVGLYVWQNSGISTPIRPLTANSVPATYATMQFLGP